MKLKTAPRIIALIAIGIFLNRDVIAQQKIKPKLADSSKNLIKLNLPTLFIKTFAFQYERSIHKKISAGFGLRYMPKGKLPYTSAFDLETDGTNGLKLGNIALTPEIKFYFGKGVFKGFYVAPFVRYANYHASVDYSFVVNNQTESIPLTGSLNTFTGGVLLGAQWRVANRIYLDWSIFGPQYGFSKGKISGTMNLSTTEQQALSDDLKTLENDFPFGKVSSTVNAQGATVRVDGPWAGIRANIGIGYRF